MNVKKMKSKKPVPPIEAITGAHFHRDSIVLIDWGKTTMPAKTEVPGMTEYHHNCNCDVCEARIDA